MTPPIFGPIARGRLRRRCRQRGFVPRADPSFEGGEAVRVKGFDQLFLEIIKERERIIIHPSKKHDDGLVPVEVRRATGLNPSTDNVAMRLVESPRQCIFAGTVNHSTYLRDETGGRRFWPIACGRIDVDGLARDRDQLWAEAKARFENGAVWWLETADLVQMASDQQIDRYEGDPWEEVIGPWVEAHPSVSISEVLEKCLQKAQALWTQTDKNRAARCLRALGWERYRERHGSRLEWRYRKNV